MTQSTMPQARNNSVLLKDLLAAPDLAFLDIAHLESEVASVGGIRLITSLDELSAAGPNTLLVLTDQVTRRGWMVTSAIRYAWERHAIGVVVKGKAHTDTAVLLAGRLGITVLTAENEATDTALRLAMQLGSSRAGLGRDVQEVQAHLESARTPAEALQVLSGALPGAEVDLVRPRPGEAAGRSAGTVGAASGSVRAPRPGALPSTLGVQSPPEPIRVAERIFASDDEADRVTVVVTTTPDQQAEAQRLLRATIPYFRSLFLQEQFDELTDALPIVGMTAPLTALEPPPSLPNGQPRNSDWERLQKRLSSWGKYVSVCVSHPQPGRVAASVVNGWRELRDRTALIRYSGGWFGFAAATVVSDGERSLDGMAREGTRVGVSGLKEHSSGRTGMAQAVRESFLASQLAPSAAPDAQDRPSAVVLFEHVAPALLDRAVPSDVAEEILAIHYPDFVAMKGRGRVAETVLAYFRHHGSVSEAASATGVHRNTVQARLQEARERHLPIDDPSSVLGLHMLLAATRHGGLPAT